MKTILIVEDVELNRELLIQLLEDRYRLLVAEDAERAIEQASHEAPDLILMDLSLPGMDGWEATRRLKSDRILHRIPIVVLSAHAMRTHEQRARESGCDAFLTKPVDEALLYRTLDRYLGH
ncbi:MAG TPA: response regulator [Casimicrobiaceae bacterium]|nr:response regulator [Casimicrobiaceae bacterium]